MSISHDDEFLNYKPFFAYYGAPDMHIQEDYRPWGWPINPPSSPPLVLNTVANSIYRGWLA